MKELLIYIVENLVDHPEEIKVIESERDGEIILELHVAQDDIGKVIGRQGRIAKEIRTIVRSMASRTGVRISVEIAG